ncbi:two-component sensor histidine kinase [Paenibacillus dendritiformis]|uniref:sensor histidine kinase n=1 Tax=Paenibacillus dendritiformis TaxID=130049 RepID=UPI001B1727FB|nr:HAMP domain-containing sensor histidine kinase [Paenibacillus dendritiformis]GIO71894.1 two-component sensor histidine kinase [Paenibacillus dendritiformis]
MKSLYATIVTSSVVIVLLSFAVGLLTANLAYGHTLNLHYEEKMREIGRSIAFFAEESAPDKLASYMEHLAGMGYQFYLFSEDGQAAAFGRDFKDSSLPEGAVQRVLDGEVYTGLLENKQRWFIPNIFENKLEFSYGLPLEARNGGRYALFIRPDMVRQTEEIRLLLAVLLAVTFGFSLVLIAIKSRYIVRPVNRLARATTELERGQYEVRLDVHRQDEIGELARRFTRMAQSIEQADTMRKQFVANVSHEIQSPLTSIRGLAVQLLEHPLPPEEERKYLHIIAVESERLSGLSRQLLTLASLDRGQEALRRAPFRLDEQLRQLLITLEPQWSEKKLELHLELEKTEMSGDAGLLHQVWMNLLSNAIKFTDTGGTLSVQCGINGNGSAEVVIRDTGKGIPAEDLPHIFDRFYKSSSHERSAQSGTGLGLSIAERIVRLHGGSIQAASEVGKGTAFTVLLPAKPSAASS